MQDSPRFVAGNDLPENGILLMDSPEHGTCHQKDRKARHQCTSHPATKKLMVSTRMLPYPANCFLRASILASAFSPTAPK